MFNVCDAEPPELLAHTVYIVCVMLTVGVPESTPFAKFRPAGTAG